ESHGIIVRHHRRAQQAGHPEPAALVRALRRGDRGRARPVAALGLEAPAGTQGRGIRGIANRSAATPLSPEAGAAHGARRVARSVPPLLVEAFRRPRAAPGQDGHAPGEEKEEDMNTREQYEPGAASGAEVRRVGEKWALVLVRELSHPPAKVWKAITD